MPQDGSESMRARWFHMIDNEYEPLREDKCFFVQPFCVYLHHALIHDGMPVSAIPTPNDIYDHLFKVIHEEYSNGQSRDPSDYFERTIPDAEWRPDLENFYPRRTQMLLSAGKFATTIPTWIWRIGTDLLSGMEVDNSLLLKEAELGVPGVAFGAWSRELPISSRLIQRLLDVAFDLTSVVEMEMANERGFSFNEALCRSMLYGISLEKSMEELNNRAQAHRDAADRIHQAHDAGFYLEAAVLTECLISNLLHESLTHLRQNPPEGMLNLQRAAEKSGLMQRPIDAPLIDDLHRWRQARNDSVHGFITCRLTETPNSLADFKYHAHQTSSVALELIPQVFEWYHRIVLARLRPRV